MCDFEDFFGEVGQVSFFKDVFVLGNTNFITDFKLELLLLSRCIIQGRPDFFLIVLVNVDRSFVDRSVIRSVDGIDDLSEELVGNWTIGSW